MELEKLKTEAAGTLDIVKLPNTFTGKVVSVEERADKRGRDCLFVRIELNDGALTQKFTPMHYRELAKAMEKLGFKDTDDMEGKTLQWEKKEQRMGNPRWFPVAKVWSAKEE